MRKTAFWTALAVTAAAHGACREFPESLAQNTAGEPRRPPRRLLLLAARRIQHGFHTMEHTVAHDAVADVPTQGCIDIRSSARIVDKRGQHDPDERDAGCLRE